MIVWHEKYKLSISKIDEEHKKLIGILNKAILAKGHNVNPKELREVLREMTNYTLMHFKTEETYMKEFNYPEYQDHKEEHRNFSTEIISYNKNETKSDYQIANEIIEHLKRWLFNHILVTDKKYIDCFKRNGLK